MERPQKEFGLLKNFPRDILGCISVFLPGEALRQIKMTGSKSFWAQWTHPNVVKSVSLGNDFPPIKSWSTFLKEFPSIREVSIATAGESNSTNRLNTLPSSLKKVTIQVHYHGTFDGIFQTDTGEPLNLVEHLPRLETLIIRGPPLYGIDWIKQFPPSLTHLVLPSGSYAPIPIDSMLPASVIHFETNTKADRFKSFPPMLESLKLHSSDLDPSWDLPSTLRTASFFRFVIDGRPDSITVLPRTLTELAVQELPSSCWPFLPPNLLKFQSLLRLPQNSSFRSVVNVDQIGTLDVHTVPLQLLPRSITHLEFQDPSWSFQTTIPTFIAEGENILPPSLKTLIAPAVILWGNTIKSLPSSLTKLSTNILHPDLYQSFPSGLTSLTMKISTVQTLATSLLALPKSLTELEIHAYQLYEAEKNIEQLVFCPLPPKLRSLNVRKVADIGDKYLECSLPHLRNLQLPEAKHFTNQSILLLNHYLTYLDLAQSDQIDGKCFASLPRSLTYLNLHSSTLIHDCDIQHLPRSLEKAFLSNAIHLTDDSIRDFPRLMNRLGIANNENITQSCIPDLPVPLKFGLGHFSVYWWELVFGEVNVTEPESDDDESEGD